MTSEGSPYAVFRRALARRDLTAVRAVSCELPSVPLEDALIVLLLILDQEPGSFERGAVRWLGRACLELRDARLGEALMLGAALVSLPTAKEGSARVLAEICRHRGLRQAAAALDSMTESTPPATTHERRV